MNIEYISGFFDADGSITLTSKRKKQLKSISINFSNNEKYILEEIKLFIYNKYNIKGYIISKKKQKETHNINYDLHYSYNNALKLCELLQSKHNKKLHRINCALKYYKKVTNRNGKYSNSELNRKKAFERLFFHTPIS